MKPPTLARRNRQRAPQASLPAVTIGRIVGLTEAGIPLVAWDGQATPCAARSLVAVDSTHIGSEVALNFEQGAAERPLVMGILQTPATQTANAVTTVEVVADGKPERLVLKAKNELILRCGDASITLTSAGKVLIRGSYVVSRSRGVNRVQGGSVQIN
jgi:hypothetical protein